MLLSEVHSISILVKIVVVKLRVMVIFQLLLTLVKFINLREDSDIGLTQPSPTR